MPFGALQPTLKFDQMPSRLAKPRRPFAPMATFSEATFGPSRQASLQKVRVRSQSRARQPEIPQTVSCTKGASASRGRKAGGGDPAPQPSKTGQTATQQANGREQSNCHK